MKPTIIRFFQLLGIALTVSSASALTTVYNYSSGSYTAGSGGSFTVALFDWTSGDVLDSVTLTVTGYSTGGSNGVENTNPTTAGTINLIEIGTNITVTGPAALVVLTTPATSASGIGLTAYDGVTNMSGTSGYTLTGAPATDTQSADIYTGFSPYYGSSGNVTFNFTSRSNSTLDMSVAPTLAGTVPATYNFDATVTYTYHNVPEVSAALLGGLGFLTLLRRRR